jgi:hypothetical protein
MSPLRRLVPKMCGDATRRVVPTTNIASFDHVVGARQQSWRHRDLQRFGSLNVYGQFVLGRRLDRQVGGLLALEDTVA